MSGIRIGCPLGGLAPCVDDLCHNTDRTLCGLYVGYDVCDHGCDPDSCSDCADEADDGALHDPTLGDADYDDDGRYVGG